MSSRSSYPSCLPGGAACDRFANSPMPSRPSSGSSRDPRAAEFAPTAGIESLLSAKEIVIACGSGGVGKTTTVATAAAMAAVHLDGRVLALTVDPARRLGQRARPPAVRQRRDAGPRASLRGCRRHRTVSCGSPCSIPRRRGTSLSGSMRPIAPPPMRSWPTRCIATSRQSSYTATTTSRWNDCTTSTRPGRYDLIVVDTPPTRNAIDFLDAPSRMADFFSSRLLRWLIAPDRSRFLTAASKPFYSVADRVLGAQFLQDIADFFILFQTMYDGFVERAEAVTRTLLDDRTSFLVVTTLDPDPVREAEFFIAELRRRSYHLGAVVFNRVLPAYLRDRDARRGRAPAQTRRTTSPRR